MSRSDALLQELPDASRRIVDMARLSDSRFFALFPRAGSPSRVASCHHALMAAYSHPSRHYHALWHIDECLGLFDEFRHLVHEPRSLELAIWFHDFVYTAGSRANEACSAEAACAWLRFLDCDEATVACVRCLILCTHTHEVPPGAPPDASLLVDIDLHPLAAPPERFEQNAALIRREFARVSDADFARGNTRMLQSFLARPRIYLTETFFSRHEQQARENLRRALEANGVHA